MHTELLEPATASHPLPITEDAAGSCLAVFLCAALGRRRAATRPLATALFALGALEATAERSALGEASRRRLEDALVNSLFGRGRRRTAAWRRSLRDFERTREGRSIRRQGETALRAWLRGEPPAPYLREVLSS